MLNLIKQYVKKFFGKSNDQAELEYRLARGMKVGKNSHLFSIATIDGGWPWLIQIGDNVTISTNVTILAHDASTNVVGCGTKLGRVVIGNNVFIGSGAIVLCNTKIGDNVIVGAGSVVSHDLPSDGVYAGVPAKKVCTIEAYRIKYERLRSEKPDFSKIRPWNQWNDASEDEKQQMIEALNHHDIGFI